MSATYSQWLQGARPHTWANAFAPVLAGSAAAVMDEGFSLVRALLAAGVALAMIVGVNYANDYSDGVRGTDDDRTGPLRLTGSGLVPPKTVKRAAFISFGVGAVCGVVLSLLSAWWLILVGIVCIVAAWFYTGGKNPYGYRGLGEVSVFVFFGLVAVLGTEFTQAGVVSWRGVVLAVVIGALSASVNLVNNLRDIPTDAAAGKVTLAVKLGDTGTRVLWQGLLGVAVVGTLLLSIGNVAALLGLAVALPVWFLAAQTVRSGAEGAALIPVLGQVGRGMLLWAAVQLLAAVL